VPAEHSETLSENTGEANVCLGLSKKFSLFSAFSGWVEDPTHSRGLRRHQAHWVTMLLKPPSATGREALIALLEGPRPTTAVTTYHGLQGFFFAISCAPRFIEPQEWMDALIAEDEGRRVSRKESTQLLDAILAVYNQTETEVADVANAPPLPADCLFRDDLLANLDEGAPVSQWARGFIKTHAWLDELWKERLPRTLEDEFSKAFPTLAFFSSRKTAQNFVDKIPDCAETKPPPSLEEIASSMKACFADAATNYAKIGRSLERWHATQKEPLHGSLHGVKVGRNALCPCGSRKKYKKCCGHPSPLA